MANKNNTNYPKKTNPVSLDHGKVPPQAVDLEEAVLGALMLEKHAVTRVMDMLQPDSFYHDHHKKIFSAILDLSSNHEPVDMLTVTEALRKRKELEEIGGAYYITQLTGKVASTANLEYHSRIITQKYIQRELIRIAAEIQQRSYDESSDVDELLNFSEDQIFQIAEGNIKKETEKINVVIEQAIQQIEVASQRDDSLSGVPTGFTKLDRITSGWQRSDLVIIAARPSMGKTAFTLSMARNMAVDHGRAVAVFSLEMSSVQLVNRLIIGETELAPDKIKNGKLKDHEWEQLESKIKKLVDAPIFIDDTPALSIFELRAKCRRLKANHNIDLVMVDYLQLMTGPPETKGNREQEVSVISRSLKGIAKELDVPIIALSQLNRSVELRSGDKRPQLSDLRESGAIEQDADLVLFIHRPEKYGITEDDDNNSTIGIAQIIVAKHRNGALGDVSLRFKEECIKFTEMESNLSGVPEEYGAQSVTYSSRMNNDFEEQSQGQENHFNPPDFDDGAPF